MTLILLLFSIVVIIATGWPIVRALGSNADFIDTLYQSAIIGMLIHGGVALILAAVGAFHIGIHMGIILAVVGSAGYWVHRARRELWPTRNELLQSNRGVALAMLGILLLTLWLNHQPSEVIFGARDAGVYANTGFMIARTGGIVQHDEVVADLAQRRQNDPDAAQAWSNLLGVQAAERFMSSRMRLAGLFIREHDASSGAYIPQFLHLFPAWIALFAAAYGVQYGLLATGLAGLMGVWSVGMAARSMVSPWVGVVAMAVLALNAVQVWFSRYPMAETTAQWLFFAAIYGIAQMGLPRRSDTLVAALIAGAAAGQFMLARLDFVFLLAPFGLWVVWRWVTHRVDTPFRWMLAGFALTGGHGIVHLLTISRGYFIDTFFARLQDTAITALLVFPLLTERLQQTFLLRPCSPLTAQPCPGESIASAPWQYGRIGLEIGLLVVFIWALFWVRRHHATINAIITARAPWWPTLTRIAAVGLIVAASYAYVVRPQILTLDTLAQLPQCAAPGQLRAPQGACLTLQGYIGAPVSPPVYADPLSQGVSQAVALVRGREYAPTPLRDLYANSMANFVRIGWYLSPWGIVLGIAGASIMLWQGVHRRNWLFLAVTLGTAFLYIQLSYGTSSQTYIYIMRRYLTNVYPGLAIFVGVSVVALWGTAWWRKLASIASISVLMLFLALTVRPVIAQTELHGAFDTIDSIAALSTSDDITLIRGGSPYYGPARDAIDVLALPLVAIHDQAVFGIRSPQPEKYGRELTMLFQRWMAEQRSVYLLLGANGALWFPDMHLEKREYVAVTLPEFSQLLNQKPALFGVMTIAYQRYELVAGAGTLPNRIDTTDTASQVSGFYPSERIAGRTFAWTTGDAVVRFSTPNTPVEIVVQAAAGVRPAGAPAAQLCLAYAGQALPWNDSEPQWQQAGCQPLRTDSASYRFTIPNIPPSDTDTLLVMLQSDSWVPGELDATQNDLRSLGFQFEGAQVQP